MENEDRRRYFRITDKMYLAVKYIRPEDEQVAELSLENQFSGSTLLTELDKINRDVRILLSEIRTKQPMVSKIIDLQNQKIDLLVRTLAQDDADVHEDLVEVDLSAVGMRFNSDQNYQLNDLLQLKLVLQPTLVGMIIVSQVQKSDALESGGYSIAVDFQHILENDQEALIKHVVNKQYEALQARRKEIDGH